MDTTSDLVLYVSFPCALSPLRYGYNQLFIADSSAKAAYIDAVGNELSTLDTEIYNRPIKAVRLGGGASIMNADKMCSLVRSIKKLLTLDTRAEVSIDVNPLTVCTPSMTDWTSCGINRINLKAYSIHDDELLALGASHTFSDIKNALLFLERFHISNVSLDLLYGLPKQTLSSWENTLKESAAFGCPHITVLPLVESDPNKSVDLPTREQRLEMFEAAHSILEDRGYREYLVGSFVAKTAIHAYDRYETLQRNSVGCLSLGAGATSYYDGFYYELTSKFDQYIEHSTTFELIVNSLYQESNASKQIHYLQGSFDLLKEVKVDISVANDNEEYLDPITMEWLASKIEKGQISKIDDIYFMTDIGRFDRAEELGQALIL